MEMMKFQITTRTEFVRLANTQPDTLTDLERAARFLYLQRTAFGGKPSGQNFGMHRNGPARLDITKLASMLEDLHSKMAAVITECLPYDEFIRRYNANETLFCLDPPYYRCENYCGKGLFERDDFARIRDALTEIMGTFIMSINGVPEIRRLYDCFHIETVNTNYTVQSGPQKTVTELLISNQPLEVLK